MYLKTHKAGKRPMRGIVVLSITQTKCIPLLSAIQEKFGGNITLVNGAIKWESAKSLPIIFEVLYPNSVMKKQKLRCLLKNLLGVNIQAKLIRGKGRGGAFSCVPPSREWTACKWRDFLGTETLLPWSR